jgi:hypothetical protein
MRCGTVRFEGNRPAKRRLRSKRFTQVYKYASEARMGFGIFGIKGGGATKGLLRRVELA